MSVVKIRDFLICMKKIITLSCFSLSFLTLFCIVGSQSACQKANTNCGADITVKDGSNNPVVGATVKLYAPNSTAGATGVTGKSGTVSFSFSLPAIFDISATDAASSTDTLKGTGLIQLQIGQTVNSTVTVK